MSSDPETAGMTVYEAAAPLRLRDLTAVWHYRELLLILAARDLTVRYRQTAVGLAWAVLQPLATMAVFLTLFTLLGRVPAGGGVPYPLVILAGLVPWQLFAGTVGYAGNSLVHNTPLISKVYFPRVLLPMTGALTNFADFCVGFVLLAIGMAYYGFAPAWSVVFLPAIVVLLLTAAMAVGLWVSALNALYRDISIVIPFLLQIGFFATPVMYESAALVPPAYRPWVALNPMVGIVEGFRWSVLGGDPPVWSLSLAVVGVAGVLAGGLFYFRRVERFLVDRI